MAVAGADAKSALMNLDCACRRPKILHVHCAAGVSKVLVHLDGVLQNDYFQSVKELAYHLVVG